MLDVKSRNVVIDVLSEYRNICIVILSILLMSMYSYFIISSYKIGAFPDEGSHTSYIVNGAFPDYKDGVVIGTDRKNHLKHPFLYYSISHYVGNLIGFNGYEDAKRIRYVNIVINSLILLFTYLTIRLFKLSTYGVAFAILTILSIPMFLMLGSSVNNDPLGFLGCAVFLYGLCRLHFNRSFAIELMVVGGVVAALTKATAALTIICLAGSYAAFNWRLVMLRIAGLKAREIAVIGAGCLAVIGYYAFVIIQYGHPFPKPGLDPSENYANRFPDAERRTLAGHIHAFFWSNLRTLTVPYGHMTFPDLPLRVTGLKILLGFSAAIIFVYAFISNLRREELSRLVNSLIVAFLIFMAYYFYEIYRLHVRTGYPGAIQARYFFGFLPVFAVLAALGFDRIKFRSIQLALLTLAGLCVAGLYTFAAGPPADNRIVYQTSNGADGLDIRMSSVFGGVVDSLRVEGNVVSIVGWAADRKESTAAPVIVAFRGSDLIGVAVPTIPRPDLVSVGILRTSEPAGFRLMLRIPDWNASHACDLKFFAIQKEGSAAPLRTNSICKR